MPDTPLATSSEAAPIGAGAARAGRAAWLIDLIGELAAFRVVETFGGTELLVPQKFTRRSRLVRETRLSPDTLAPLARDRGGEHVRIPLCREWRVQVYRAQGLSQTSIARRLSIHQDTVARILNRTPPSGQMELL